MQPVKRYQFERIQKTKGDLNVQKPIRKSDGKPNHPMKITVLPSNESDQKPYNLLNLKKVKDPKTSETVLKTVMDLTPQDMKSVNCAHHVQTTLCIPQCASMLKPKKPFRKTVQYFRDPSLNFAEVLNSFKTDYAEGKHESKDRSDSTITCKAKDEEVDCILHLSGTGLINLVDIEQTNLSRKTAAGKDVLHQNEKYNTLLNTQRTCADQTTQTLPGEVNKDVRSQETLIDSDISVKITRSIGVDPLVYDDHDDCDKCKLNTDNYSSENYLNQFPPNVVIDRIIKLALLIERHLDQDEKKLVNIGRFSNEEEEINYGEKDMLEIVNNITMELLFTISSDLGSVAIMDWHPGHEHMLAVAYTSEHHITNDLGKFRSFVYIWNLNNTKNPERIYKFPTRRIVGMEFSKWKPYHLLIARLDGYVQVVDVLPQTKLSINDTDTPRHIIASNSVNESKVRVCCVSWYNFDDDDNESFLCCKEDGKVWKCTLKPPYFENKLLMKCSPNIILNNFPSHSYQELFDLVTEDTRLIMNDIFYVAREGKLHAISQSTKEILNVYNAHRDSVITSFDFSPFVEQIFLTSGFDGIIKIWWEKMDNPLFTFKWDAVPVSKARWHPRLSTVIISIVQTEIHLWDIAQNREKPFLIRPLPSNESIEDFVFSKNGINLCVGGSRGNVFVLKILTESNLPFQLQVRLLCETVLSWIPPRTVSRHLKSLYPWIFGSDRHDETTMVEKQFDLLKAAHPLLFRDPIQTKTFAEILETLFCTSEENDGTEEQIEESAEMKKKCLRKIVKRLSKSADYVSEQFEESREREEALRRVLAE